MKKHKNSPTNKAKEAAYHPKNKHQGEYNFDELIAALPELSAHIEPNAFGKNSIDFSDPEAVKALNKALLFAHYNLGFWDIPEGYLCPPIPGRAEYLLRISDVLAGSNIGRLPTGDKIMCMDIGIGANAIYGLLAHQLFGWKIIGSEIDETAIAAAQKNIDNNKLTEAIAIKKQVRSKDIFYGILQKTDKIDVCVCNPPFHASADEAQDANQRKTTNLNLDVSKSTTLNFGGQSNELHCEGGERKFVGKLIRESKSFSSNCFWFTCLISKKDHIRELQKALKTHEATDVRVIPMLTGNKQSRVLMWTFLNTEEQSAWRKERWS